MTKASLLYLASLGAHGALAIGVFSLKAARAEEDVTIALVESAKPKESPPPPPPVLKDEPVKPEAKAKAAPAAPKAAKLDAPPPPETASAPPPGAGSDAPDFGLALTGGSGGGGLSVPSGPARAAPAASNAPIAKKVLTAAPPTPADACTEALVKPKVVGITQPAYTREAREANVAGKVRVEVTVDATGKVSAARVLEGLGYGLDEAALAAARGASFEAGARCGKPTSATFVIAIRFSL